MHKTLEIYLLVQLQLLDAQILRGVFGGIRNPGYVTDMEFITIASTGNSQDFGDQTNNRGGAGNAISSTRGVWYGGYGSPAFRNTIDFVTIPTTEMPDFGDLTYSADRVAGCSTVTEDSKYNYGE